MKIRDVNYEINGIDEEAANNSCIIDKKDSNPLQEKTEPSENAGKERALET